MPQKEYIALPSFRNRRTYRQGSTKYANTGFHEAGRFARASFTDMIQELTDRDHTISCVPIYTDWMEVDSFEEYQGAWAMVRK